MNKMEAEFANLVKAYRKRHMGKGPSKVTVTFCRKWAVCEMEGNLSPVEKFIATADEGRQMLRAARTEMVKQIYRDHPPVEMERLLGLARLSIGPTAMTLAEDRAHGILDRLMRDLTNPDPPASDSAGDVAE